MHDEPPVHVMVEVGHWVADTAHQVAEEVAGEAVHDHEQRCHAIPPPNRAPLTAIPYPDVVMTDEQVVNAIELLMEGEPEDVVAHQLDIPLLALQRHLAEYRRRHGDFLFRRATTG